MEILYISYDGVLEPLGESQVVGYLRHIAAAHAVTLLSYEKRADLQDRSRLSATADQLRGSGIRWIRLRYHRRPSLIATAWDVLRGWLVAWPLCRGGRIGLVHARGYVASVIAWSLKRGCGVKFIFDMRGFWPEEKVEAGHWRCDSLAYRLAKRWEARLFSEAAAIVSLTTAGVETFSSLGYTVPPAVPIAVITTCADVLRFSPQPPDPALVTRLGLDHHLVAGCVGTLSNWYLRGPTLAYLALLAQRFERLKVLFVTREDHTTLHRDALAAGIPETRFVMTRADFGAMPAHLRLMALGVFFISPTRSKRGSAATKLAEFLASGVPVVINDGVGDSGAFVREHGAGLVLHHLSQEAFEASLEPLRRLLCDQTARARCRRVAEEHLDLRVGVAKYLALYRRLTLGEVAGEPMRTFQPLEQQVAG